MERNKKLRYWLLVCGILNVVFYLLHDVYLIDDENAGSRQGKVKLIEIKPGEEIQSRTIISFSEANLKLSAEAKVVVQGFETLQEGSLVSIADCL